MRALNTFFFLFLASAAQGEGVVPMRLKVLTFNVAGGAAGAYGFTQPMNVERTAAIIRDSGADFVALQEVDKNIGRYGNPRRDTSAVLAEAAGYPFEHFGKAVSIGGGDYGNALLSKTKPAGLKTVRLPGTGEARVFIDARYTMAGGKTLSVCATHLCHASSASRLAQVEGIIAHYAANPADRVIIAGDLNAAYDSPELTRLNEVFGCLTPEPEKATYLGGGKAIDHVYVFPKSGTWGLVVGTGGEAVSGRRGAPEGEPPASDHLALIVTLQSL